MDKERKNSKELKSINKKYKNLNKESTIHNNNLPKETVLEEVITDTIRHIRLRLIAIDI